jgi:hypothetical protein
MLRRKLSFCATISVPSSVTSIAVNVDEIDNRDRPRFSVQAGSTATRHAKFS